MPYRRSYARRRRPIRRRRRFTRYKRRSFVRRGRRSGGRRFGRSSKGSSLPTYCKKKFEKCFRGTLTSSAGTIYGIESQFEINNIQAESPTPALWDEWVSFFHHYRVTGCAVTYIMQPVVDASTQAQVFFALPLNVDDNNEKPEVNDNTAPSFVGFVCRNAIIKKLNGKNADNSRLFALKFYRSLRRMLTPQEFKDSWTETDTVPAVRPRFDVGMYFLDGTALTASTVYAKYELKITWYVEFKDRSKLKEVAT